MDASTALLILAAVAPYLIWLIRFIMRSLIHPNSHLDHGAINKEELSIIESSASTSAPASYPPPITKYDVFLSFRGEDTRDNFTSHLYEALCRAKINTFIDYRLERGGEIWTSLEKALDESQIFVIIFSVDYASSTWCLDELVKILECNKRDGRVVIPVFYNIDPSNVRKQSGSYGDAFRKHEERFKGSKEKVQAWKDALFQATSLSGWDSRKTRPEAKFIREIVQHILEKLNGMSSCDLGGFVGIDEHIKNMELLLNIGSPDVHIVGIWGMGGIGKTTIADVVFHKLKAQFESCSFVANVREQLARNGPEYLQNKCLTDLLGEDFGTSSTRSTFVKSRLQSKKILLVLDDVDNSIRADDLVEVSHCFGQGSRIIITSRDKHVLKNAVAKETYHVQEMNFLDSLRLFSLKAFKKNQPANENVELSERVVHYCRGNPLALTVLGSFLYGRREEEWRSALAKLEKAQKKEIFDVLKISFDGLDEGEKDIFLDLACFFAKGGIRPYVHDMSDYYELPDAEISVLIERCLISVDADGQISMHDLVLAMGQEISQQLSKIPGQPIRLWKHDDIYHALSNNKGSKAIRCISLDMCKTKKIYLHHATFQKMYNLRFLEFYKSDLEEPSRVHIPRGLENLPDELRILRWEEYPLPSLPIKFYLENLVELIMPRSHLERLWDGDQFLPNLKMIDLSYSRRLTELPNFSQTCNIEKLYLSDCVSLVQIYSSSPLLKLKILSLSDCDKLRSMELASMNCWIVYWEKCLLRTLPLSLCSKNLVILLMPYSHLERLWDGDQILPNLSLIDLSGSRHLIELPNLSQICNIEELRLMECVSLVQLYSSSSLFKLKYLRLSRCDKLGSVEFDPINCETISWKGCPLRSFPMSFCSKNLVSLHLENSNLEQLWDGDQYLPNLEEIHLDDCKQLIGLPDLHQAPNIEVLSLRGCSRLVQLYSSSSLFKLKHLDFSHCDKLGSVEFVPINCETISWKGCPLRSLPMSFCSKKLVSLHLENSNLEQLWDGEQYLPNLKEIHLDDSKQLIGLPDLRQAPNIKILYLFGCSRLVQVYSSSFLYKLNYINLLDCYNLRSLHLSSNIDQGSSVLVACYNYFNLNDFSLIKVNVSLSASNPQNKLVLRLKVVSVPYIVISECMDSVHSAELQLLGETLASSLPYLTKLRWLHIPSSIGQFSQQFELQFFHEYFDGTKGSRLRLLRTSSEILDPTKSLTRYPCIKGTTINGESSPMEQLTDLENSTESCFSSFENLLKVPNDMSRLSFITELSLQKSDIVSVPVSIPGFSSLISLAVSDWRSHRPVIDLSVTEDLKKIMWVGYANENTFISIDISTFEITLRTNFDE